MPCMSSIICERQFPPATTLRTVLLEIDVDDQQCDSYDRDGCVPHLSFEVAGSGRAQAYHFALDRTEHPEVLSAPCP